MVLAHGVFHRVEQVVRRVGFEVDAALAVVQRVEGVRRRAVALHRHAGHLGKGAHLPALLAVRTGHRARLGHRVLVQLRLTANQQPAHPPQRRVLAHVRQRGRFEGLGHLPGLGFLVQAANVHLSAGVQDGLEGTHAGGKQLHGI
ncbi:hypothetical protein [Deinococcus wulumuqiensis]|uniref:hypothetical protein n=1 Tax=Deinococcus wulumuqiensis TaxID=980427 RepID=UPI00139F2A43|nr:hypothetical protein [Deinococcus wulumuqiensis]